ncbi:ABC transporter permease [Chloroflexota bacterium]
MIKGLTDKLIKWWRIYRVNTLGVIGLVTFVILVVLIIIGPWIAPYDPGEMSPDKWLPPSWKHLLGTNKVGQDIFSKLLYSGQISLLLGVVAASATSIIGTTIGLIAGYYGGLVDEVILRICDVIMTLPALPLMLIMAVVLGPGWTTILLVIVITGWARPVRRMRVMVLSMKTAPYVQAAKSMGASSWRIIFRHMLPNVGGLFSASITLGITRVIMLEAALSFLGFGDPLHESLGIMLHTAQSEGAFSRGAWWTWIPPGLVLTMIGLSCIFIGNAINERFVLRLRRRRGMF